MTQQPPSDYVLVVDDDAELVRIVLAALRRLEVQTKVASTGRQALQTVVDDTPAVILLDMRLPDMLGMEVLQYIRDHGLVTTVIVMTAYGSVDIAVEAMRLGAYDFLTKPLDLKRLDVVMRNSLERQRLLAELDDYRRGNADASFHGLIGASPAMQRLFRQVRNAAPGGAPVLVAGPRGCGKASVARAIHEEGERKGKPFVVAGVDDTTDAEAAALLFGSTSIDGLVQDAAGGTLFIKEVATLAPDIQKALLRMIRTGQVRRAGSETDEDADVRIVAGTASDLKAETDEGRFNEDLFYRINVVSVLVPSLRERGDDVVALADSFLAALGAAEGRPARRISEQAKQALLQYDWPGNVEELREILTRAVGQDASATLELTALPEHVAVCAGVRTEQAGAAALSVREHSLGDNALRAAVKPLWRVEYEAIQKALKLCNGDVSAAARLLEVTPSTIYRKERIFRTRVS